MDEAQAQAMLQELDSLQRSIQAGERRLGLLEQSMLEVQQAKVTLEAMAAGELGAPVLIPIGAGVQIKGVIATDHPVLRPIGAQTALEGTAQEAVSELHERQTQMQQAYQQMAGQIDQLAARARQYQDALSDAGA